MIDSPRGTHNEVSGTVAGTVIQAGTIQLHVTLLLQRLLDGSSPRYLRDALSSETVPDDVNTERAALADQLVHRILTNPGLLTAEAGEVGDVQVHPSWFFDEVQRILALVADRLADQRSATELAAQTLAELAELRRQISSLTTSPASTDGGRVADLGQAPVQKVLRGRRSELATLRHCWDKRHPVVMVVARGGMGKTALAATFARSVAPQCDVVFWRSVYNCQPLGSVLRELLALLIPDFRSDADMDARELFPMVLEQFRARRCLFVLDNLESLLSAGEHTGRLREDCADYESFLAMMAREDHASQVLITTREIPTFLAPDAAHLMRLGGLDDEAGLELIEAHQVGGSAEDRAKVINAYGGNPLELIIAAGNIRALYNGDIGAFLTDDVATSGETHGLLERQVARLDPLAQDVLTWLAVRREPVTVDEIQQCLNPPPAGKRRVVDALAMLTSRTLADPVGAGRFGTQPVIAEYVVDRRRRLRRLDHGLAVAGRNAVTTRDGAHRTCVVSDVLARPASACQRWRRLRRPGVGLRVRSAGLPSRRTPVWCQQHPARPRRGPPRQRRLRPDGAGLGPFLWAVPTPAGRLRATRASSGLVVGRADRHGRSQRRDPSVDRRGGLPDNVAGPR
ncbi:hypothetical protein JOF56_007374 [Kibdelosporangium banguiense]|uniref:ORC1/DEAH AAA+ ATPase domain-containing protein n=1 Tax=Kibdelosporangium banguiense TaxID=1365924 RepID=A0ABS4TRE2_9PSEU|nr:AAA family ATPase [Kibdelosporangium banguiense]MBP2326989.1 hypothetical protein [Kibdelosporangium banguiense]